MCTCNNWKLMESAPLEMALLLYDLGVTQGKWYDYDFSHSSTKVRPVQKYTGWLDNDGNIINPTHWQYLPAPPTTGEGV